MENNHMSPKRNITSNATKVIQGILEAYETGILDDPNASAHFCGLLACVCEGKVSGVIDEVTGKVKWSLTKEYAELLQQKREAALASALQGGKVIPGPWS